MRIQGKLTYVSPNNWKRARSPRRTPAVTEMQSISIINNRQIDEWPQSTETWKLRNGASNDGLTVSGVEPNSKDQRIVHKCEKQSFLWDHSASFQECMLSFFDSPYSKFSGVWSQWKFQTLDKPLDGYESFASKSGHYNSMISLRLW